MRENIEKVIKWFEWSKGWQIKFKILSSFKQGFKHLIFWRVFKLKLFGNQIGDLKSFWAYLYFWRLFSFYLETYMSFFTQNTQKAFRRENKVLFRKVNFAWLQFSIKSPKFDDVMKVWNIKKSSAIDFSRIFLTTQYRKSLYICEFINVIFGSFRMHKTPLLLLINKPLENIHKPKLFVTFW